MKRVLLMTCLFGIQHLAIAECSLYTKPTNDNPALSWTMDIKNSTNENLIISHCVTPNLTITPNTHYAVSGGPLCLAYLSQYTLSSVDCDYEGSISHRTGRITLNYQTCSKITSSVGQTSDPTHIFSYSCSDTLWSYASGKNPTCPYSTTTYFSTGYFDIKENDKYQLQWNNIFMSPVKGQTVAQELGTRLLIKSASYDTLQSATYNVTQKQITIVLDNHTAPPNPYAGQNLAGCQTFNTE